MKRKAKKKKREINLMKPITDPFSFGSADDPCFGKLYSTKASECRGCADNEICAIATMQKTKLKRDSLSKKQAFLDEEDVAIDVVNALKNIVITNNITRLQEVAKHIKKRFGSEDLRAARLLILKSIKNNKTFKITKKDGKRFIRAVKA